MEKFFKIALKIEFLKLKIRINEIFIAYQNFN